MVEGVECKTEFATIESNRVEVSELMEELSKRGGELQTTQTSLLTWSTPVALGASWKSGRSNSVIIPATSGVAAVQAYHAFRKESGASEEPMDRET